MLKTPRKSGLCLALICLVGTVAVSSCGKKALAITPPWEIGEKSVFEIKRDGKVLATWEMRVDPDEAGIALTSELKGQGFKETARVKVDPRSLLPEAVSFAQETEMTKTGYTATYTTDEAIVTPEPAKGAAAAPVTRISIPEGTHFENESFLMILRAMPLKKGFRAKVADVVTRSGTVADVEIKVIREETVKTILGDTKASVVQLVGFSQTIWIAKDAPRQILRFENEAGGTVSELVSYKAK